MSIAEIKELYDSNLNMTLAELSKITGLSQNELFYLLTCAEEEYSYD